MRLLSLSRVWSYATVVFTEPPSSGRSYSFRIIDVFAERAFAGKPTAVFTDARGLQAAQMSAIARELRFPQTAFVFPADRVSAQARVRVFTPNAELPRAEHLTIAAVYALGLEEKLSRNPEWQDPKRVVLEEQDGPVSVYFRAQVITVKQKLPEFGSHFSEPNALAAMLGLNVADLQACPAQAVLSAGVPFLIVPVKAASLLGNARFRPDIWDRTVKQFEAPNVVAFALNAGAHYSIKARAFLPSLGVLEDPATEAACGPLVAYALRHGLLSPPEQFVASVEQGVEIDRPSVIQVFIDHRAGLVREVRVGGQCQLVGDGRLLAPVVR